MAHGSSGHGSFGGGSSWHGGTGTSGTRTIVHNTTINNYTTYNNGGGYNGGWGGNQSYLGGLIQIHTGYNNCYPQQYAQYSLGFGNGYNGYGYGGYPPAYPGQYAGGYVAPSSGPGWLGRQWDGLCNWFSNVFGGSDNKTITPAPQMQQPYNAAQGGDNNATALQRQKTDAGHLVHLGPTDEIPLKLDPRTNTLLMREVSPAQAEALRQNLLNDRDMQAALHMAFATELVTATRKSTDAAMDMHENAEIQKIKDAIRAQGVDADTLKLIEKRNGGMSVAELAQQYLVNASEHNEKVTDIKTPATPSVPQDPSKGNARS